MTENIRPVSKQALLGNIEGPKVYVSPTTSKISDKPTADSAAIPYTKWFTPEGEVGSSPIFSVPEVRERIKLEASEMAIYFPDFNLCEKDDGTIFYLGRIDGIGDIRITFPLTYPAQKFLIEALDLEESFNNELKQIVWSYNGITPAGAIVVAMRLFLLRKVAER
jgi:hypothetical protein